MTSENHADVIAPPPLLYVGALALVAALHWLWPLVLVSDDRARWAAFALILAGLLLVGWGAYVLRRARTAVNPYRRSSQIIQSGPFRFTRNPLYLGMDAAFVGVLLWFGSLWGIPVLIGLLVLVHYGVILREERYLDEQFGEEYRDYRGKVRRYL